MKYINLPAETTHVLFTDIPSLVATALFPNNDQPVKRNNCERFVLNEILVAAADRKLRIRNPFTLGQIEPDKNEHGLLMDSVVVHSAVTVSDLIDYVADREIIVVIAAAPAINREALRAVEDPTRPNDKQNPALVGIVSASDGDEEWKEKAKKHAYQIIKRDGLRDFYPSQINVADEVAKKFRGDGVMGAGGKPLSGASIKRHALKGISSAKDKTLSTAISRGK